MQILKIRFLVGSRLFSVMWHMSPFPCNFSKGALLHGQNVSLPAVKEFFLKCSILECNRHFQRVDRIPSLTGVAWFSPRLCCLRSSVLTGNWVERASFGVQETLRTEQHVPPRAPSHQSWENGLECGAWNHASGSPLHKLCHFGHLFFF